jgi:hypothetical protein
MYRESRKWADLAPVDPDSRHYWYLFARHAGGCLLRYTSQGKFARRGEPARFLSGAAAERRGNQMIARFPVLRGFQLWAA